MPSEAKGHFPPCINNKVVLFYIVMRVKRMKSFGRTLHVEMFFQPIFSCFPSQQTSCFPAVI